MLQLRFMRFGPARLCLAFLVGILLTTFAPEPGFAAGTDSWTNQASGLWSDAASWSSNQLPNSSFSLTAITNDNSKTVTIDSAAPLSSLSVQDLTVSAPAGALNTLALLNVTTNVPLQVAGSLTIDHSLLTLSNSAITTTGMRIDHGGAVNVTNAVMTGTGFTTYDVINGSIWLDSGSINCSTISAVRIGRTNSAAGTVTVNGGTFLAPLWELATSTGSTGVLNVVGGIVNASSIFTVGYGVNSSGTVLLAGGQLIATNDFSYVGKSGFGQMTLNAGNGTFAFLSIGNNANGQLSMNGGQLLMKPRDTNDWLQIGNIGAGQFNMSGGTVLALGQFHVGDDSSGLGTGSGTALITGGQIIATNDITAIARYGPGQMTISNATAWLANVSVGRHDGSVGTLTVLSNAQVYLTDALSIGRFSNSVGHVFMQGGLLSLTNDSIWVGREGSGDMTLSSGTVRAASAFVALSTVVTDAVTLLPVTNVPVGTLTVSGGSMLLTSNLLVGSSGISTGQVSVLGGALSVSGSGAPAYVSVASGSFAMSQGNLVVDNLYLTNSTGQFVFNSGTLQAKNAVIANGAPFVVGDGVNPATLELLGGVYSFADGLVITNNATVTGCGTLIGNISNFGTLTTNCGPTGVTITQMRRVGTTNTVFFTTLNGSNHVLQYKNSFADPSWTALLPGVIGTGAVTNKADTNATTAARFYRIHLQ
jgi:hypothetical protein